VLNTGLLLVSDKNIIFLRIKDIEGPKKKSQKYRPTHMDPTNPIQRILLFTQTVLLILKLNDENALT